MEMGKDWNAQSRFWLWLWTGAELVLIILGALGLWALWGDEDAAVAKGFCLLLVLLPGIWLVWSLMRTRKAEAALKKTFSGLSAEEKDLFRQDAAAFRKNRGIYCGATGLFLYDCRTEPGIPLWLPYKEAAWAYHQRQYARKKPFVGQGKPEEEPEGDYPLADGESIALLDRAGNKYVVYRKHIRGNSPDVDAYIKELKQKAPHLITGWSREWAALAKRDFSAFIDAGPSENV